MKLSHAEWAEAKERELEDARYEEVLNERRKKLQEQARRRKSKELFNEWLLHKESFEKAVQLLSQVNRSRCANVDQWFEVAVALNAVDCLRGIYKQEEYRGLPADRDPSHNASKEEMKKRKTLASEFFRWSKHETDGKEFESVPIEKETAKTFTLGAQEIMEEYAEHLERDGEYIAPNIKYTAPKVKQAKHDRRNLHNPDTAKYNAIWTKLIKKEYKKAQQTMYERLDARTAKMDSSVPIDQAERRALNALGLGKLAKMVEDDLVDNEKIEKDRAREDKEYAKKVHQGFIAKKNAMRVRVPSNSDDEEIDDELLQRSKVLFGRSTNKENSGKMDFSKGKKISVRPVKNNVADNTVDLLDTTNKKYVYATNKRDLEVARQKLAKEGHVYKENFRDVDGDPLDDEYRDAKKAISKKERLMQRVKEREEKAQESYENWATQKELRSKALVALKHIDKPGQTGGGQETDEAHWRYVGEQLKAIDGALFGEWSKWSAGFKTAGQCKATWDSLPPNICDTCCPSSMVHTVLLKLLNRPGLDFSEVFGYAVEKRLKRMMASDGRSYDDVTDEERSKVEENLELNPTQFRQTMLDAGIKLQPHEVRILSSLFDTNGDGLISRKEFLGLTGYDPRPGARGEALKLLRDGKFCCWEASCHVTGLTSAYEVMPATEEEEEDVMYDLEQSRHNGDDSDADVSNSNKLAPSAKKLPLRLRSGKVKKGWVRVPLPDLSKRIKRLVNSADRNASDFLVDPPKSCEFSSWSNTERFNALDGLETLADGNKKVSKTLALQTEGEPPLAPELVASDITSESISLIWKPQEGSMFPSFYVLETAGREGSKNHRTHTFKELMRDPPTALEGEKQACKYVFNSLQPGTRYFFRIQAFNGYGASPFTHASFLTAPSRPSIPVIKSISTTTVSLSWGSIQSDVKTTSRELRDVFRSVDQKATGTVDRDVLLGVLEKRYSNLLHALDKIPSHNIPGASVLDMIESTSDGDMVSWSDLKSWLQVSGPTAATTTKTTTAATRNQKTPKSLKSQRGFQYTLCRCVGDEEVNFREEGALDNKRSDHDITCSVLKSSDWFADRSMKESFDLPQFHLVDLPIASSKASEKPALKVVLPKSKQKPLGAVVGKLTEPVFHVEVYEQAYVGSETTATVTGLEPGKSYQFRLLLSNTEQGITSRLGPSLIVHMPNTLSDAPRVGKNGVQTDSVHLVWGDAPRPEHNKKVKSFEKTIQDWVKDPQGEDYGGVSDATLRKTFMRYDRDGNGFIEGNELLELFSDLGLPTKGPAFDQARSKLDSNSDGKVSYQEFAAWWKDGSKSFVISHREGSGKWIEVYRGTNTSAVISGLAPNSKHSFVLQIQRNKSLTPKSKELVVHTAPETPLQPVVIEAGPKHARVKWYAGLKGSSTFEVDALLVDELSEKRSATSQKGKWVTMYRGSSSIALIDRLIPNSVYRIRVRALNADGKSSSQSLPSQFQTAEAAFNLERTSSKSNAASFFHIECTGDVVVGDTILFTERVFEKKKSASSSSSSSSSRRRTSVKAKTSSSKKMIGSSLSQQSMSSLEKGDLTREFVTERTVAARVIKQSPSSKGSILSMEVLWSTVSQKNCPPKYIIEKGSRISRQDADIFKFETFRAAWKQEEHRWTYEEEQEHEQEEE